MRLSAPEIGEYHVPVAVDDQARIGIVAVEDGLERGSHP